LIESFDIDLAAELPLILTPVMDGFWQACGFERSQTSTPKATGSRRTRCDENPARIPRLGERSARPRAGITAGKRFRMRVEISSEARLEVGIVG